MCTTGPSLFAWRTQVGGQAIMVLSLAGWQHGEACTCMCALPECRSSHKLPASLCSPPMVPRCQPAVFLLAVEQEARYIERVAIHLHPMFRPSTLNLTQPPFAVRWAFACHQPAGSQAECEHVMHSQSGT